MELLLEYKEDHVHTGDIAQKPLYQVISESFGLEKGCYSLKRYDKEFEEYVDIENSMEIKNMDIIKIIPELPLDASNCQSAPKELVDVSYKATRDLKTAQRTFEHQQWPCDIYLMKRFPELIEALERNQLLPSEFIIEIGNNLANFTHQHCVFPNAPHREAVIQEFIERYPSIPDQIYNFAKRLKKELVEQLKKIRATDSQLEKRLENTFGKGKTSKLLLEVSKSKKDSVLKYVPFEKELEIASNNAYMLEEYKILKSVDEGKIDQAMICTFSNRREWIVNKRPSVLEVKREYPFFFEPKYQMKEFEMIQNVSLLKTLKEFLAAKGHIILDFHRKKKPNSNYCRKLLKLSFKKPFTEMQTHLFHFAVYVLPDIFEEISFCINPTCKSESPMIKLLGDELCGPFSVVVENVTVTSTYDFVEAVAFLFSLYSTLNKTYPKLLRNTLLFIEYGMLNIQKNKIPEEVKSFYQRLSEFSSNFIL